MKIKKNYIMSMILYYSNYCSFSNETVQKVSKSQIKDDIHFICIDNRINKNNETYIILSNQKEILLPRIINKVPALMLLNRGNRIIYGQDIIEYIQPVTNNNTIEQVIDPEAFCFSDINSYGVMSDNFSFLDQSIESMSAKGNGGLRQLRNYATLEYKDSIETPPDDYIPNKIGDISMEKIQNERANAIK